MEERLHAYVHTYVATLMASQKAAADAQELQLLSAAPPEAAETCDRLAPGCFVCDGPGKAVMNKTLGVSLDDRCRKQFAVLQRGSKPIVRFELWEQALPYIECEAARQLMQKFQIAAPNRGQHVAPCDGAHADELCAVCQEPMRIGTRVQTLSCEARHVFHHECSRKWFEESASCPLCREDFTAQCGGPGRLQRTLSTKSGCKGGADCPTADDEIDADVMALLADVSGPLTDSPASASGGLIRVPSMLESWELEPTVQASLLEEALGSNLGLPDFGSLLD